MTSPGPLGRRHTDGSPQQPQRMTSRRRNQLYLIGILPSLLLLLLSLRIVFLLHYDERGQEAYSTERYATARNEFSVNRILNPVERWIAPFNEGAARYRLADYFGAAVTFQTALEYAPADRECAVRVNLALSHEGLGDQARTARDPAKAQDAWTAARNALAPCLPEPEDAEENPEPGSEQARMRQDRVHARKVDARVERKIGKLPDVREPDTAPPPDENLEAKRREVERRNREALEERRRLEDRERRPRQPDQPQDLPPIAQW